MHVARSAAELSHDPGFHRHAFEELQRHMFGPHGGGMVPLVVELDVTPAYEIQGQRWSVYATVVERYRWWKHKRVRVQPKVVALQHTLLDSTFAFSRSPSLMLLDRFLKKLIDDVLKGMPPRLYEADHRIGIVHSVGYDDRGKIYPCPIFDPPGGVQLPQYRGNRRWDRCYCGNTLQVGEHVTWGGGNLLWVCEHCSKIHNEPSGRLPMP